METIKIPKLNHSVKSLYGAIGLDFYERNIVSNTILFETIANHLLAKDLFDDPSDAPINMTCSTGILEKALDRLDLGEYKFYLLLNFNEIFNATSMAIYNIEHPQKPQKVSDDEETSQDLMMKLFKKLHGNPIARIIKVIKESSYDYDRFMKMTLPIDKRSDINAIGDKIEASLQKGQNMDNFLGGMMEDDDGM